MHVRQRIPKRGHVAVALNYRRRACRAGPHLHYPYLQGLCTTALTNQTPQLENCTAGGGDEPPPASITTAPLRVVAVRRVQQALLGGPCAKGPEPLSGSSSRPSSVAGGFGGRSLLFLSRCGRLSRRRRRCCCSTARRASPHAARARTLQPEAPHRSHRCRFRCVDWRYMRAFMACVAGSIPSVSTH